MPLKFETALFDYLSGDAYIASLVNTRIFQTRMPEKTTLPAISWHRVSTSRVYTFDRYEDTNAWSRPRIQFNCWGRTAEEAELVGEAVLLALSGYEGDMAGQLIGSSEAVDEFDVYETPTKFFRRILDFQMAYEDDLEGAS